MCELAPDGSVRGWCKVASTQRDKANNLQDQLDGVLSDMAAIERQMQPGFSEAFVKASPEKLAERRRLGALLADHRKAAVRIEAAMRRADAAVDAHIDRIIEAARSARGPNRPRS